MRLSMTRYIGVDVGKTFLHIYLPVTDKTFEVSNNIQGFNELLSNLYKQYDSLLDIIITFEPTGGYERSFREFLKSNKINFAIVHPNKVRSYAKAKGLLAKSDAMDSKLIADYAAAFLLQVKQDYNTVGQQRLHALIQRREQLIVIKNQESNRLETEHDQFIVALIKEHMTYLNTQLKLIENTVKELCDKDSSLQSKLKFLTSIPGVGIVLATKAILTVPELGQIEPSKLTSLAGLAPYARDSGSYKGKRSIFAGKAALRKVLYMAAVASLRCNQKLKCFYDHLIANHKPSKVALVAVMRKLLGFMNAVLKNNSLWNNNYALS